MHPLSQRFRLCLRQVYQVSEESDYKNKYIYTLVKIAGSHFVQSEIGLAVHELYLIHFHCSKIWNGETLQTAVDWVMSKLFAVCLCQVAVTQYFVSNCCWFGVKLHVRDINNIIFGCIAVGLM